jgi:hypothetical protein
MGNARKRRRFTFITGLWPVGVIVLLLAATWGYYWLISRDLRMERKPASATQQPVAKK